MEMRWEIFDISWTRHEFPWNMITAIRFNDNNWRWSCFSSFCHHLTWWSCVAPIVPLVDPVMIVSNMDNTWKQRFTQYLATSNCTFNLTNFLDKSLEGMQMSTFIRRYAKYINAKAYSYRVVGSDFAKMKRGGQNAAAASNSAAESLRVMTGDKLLKTLPVLQSQVDSMLEFDAHPRDLNNGLLSRCNDCLLMTSLKHRSGYCSLHAFIPGFDPTLRMF